MKNMKNMELKSIKKHLKAYSIEAKRKSTINHAFASALAASDDYDRDQERLKEGMILLGQTDLENLTCFYCGKEANSWDHVQALVNKGVYTGYGHQVGNLVPCCSACNSTKGNKDWHKYIESVAGNKKDLKIKQMSEYVEMLGDVMDYEKIKEVLPAEIQEYEKRKEKIIQLMKEADEIAKKIRLKLYEKETAK